MISVLFAFLAAWALIQAQNVWAFLFLALSGFCDLLDGWLARARSLNSPAGELLDTFCDRVSEILILSAFIWLALNSRAGESMRLWGVFASVISMVGALMMSFASALIPRKARVHRGILRRPERAILTAFAALFLQIFPGVSLSLLWVMGMGALSSAFFRILAYRRLLLRGEEKNDKPLERSRVVEEPQRPAEW
jgi:CDP-diacylglycerol--glycerol-3-phosphate 3-phosphatidyltransferase